MSKGDTPRRFAPTLDPYVPTECSRAFGVLEFHMCAVWVHPKVPVRALLLLVRMLFRPREGDWDSSVRVKAAEEKKFNGLKIIIIQYYSQHARLLMYAHVCTRRTSIIAHEITMVILHALLLLQY